MRPKNIRGGEGPFKRLGLIGIERPPKLVTKLRLIDAVTEREQKWLWWPYIPAGAITLLVGQPGAGKGLVSASLAAAVANGGKFPDGSTAPCGTVLWLETEDPAEEVLKPRLQAAGVDPDVNHGNVMMHSWMGDPDSPDISDAATFIDMAINSQKNPLKLIVLSPLKSFVPELTDANKETEVRAKLGLLNQMVAGSECAILGLIHMNKKTDLDALDRIGGSGAFAQMARSALGVVKEEGSEEQDIDRRFAAIKQSYGPSTRQLLFRAETYPDKPKESQWVRAVWREAEDWRDPSAFFKTLNPVEDQSAGEWLHNFLAARGGRALKAEAVEAWEVNGGKVRTLETAFSRGKNRGLFASDIGGFQGEATWMLPGTARMPPLQGHVGETV